jgi:hypothetical protein
MTGEPCQRNGYYSQKATVHNTSIANNCADLTLCIKRNIGLSILKLLKSLRSKSHQRNHNMGRRPHVKMGRLTENPPYPLPANTFMQCMLCGFTAHPGREPDICEFVFYYEGNDSALPGKPRPSDYTPSTSAILVTCRGSGCDDLVGRHPRLYQRAPWSRARPGAFSLTCGNCPARVGTHCKHPDAIFNGGKGLSATQANLPIMNIMICGPQGCGTLWGGQPPIVSCSGNPKSL